MSAVLVSATGAIQSYAGTATPIAKPANPQLGDVLVISFLMNGAPTVPTGWTIKFSGDNNNVLVWARVDGTNITAANDGQTFAFGDGGGATYYSHVIGLIRGAVTAGDPFDGAIQPTVDGDGGTSSPLLGVTTTEDDALLIYAAHVLFGPVTVTSATSPLVVANNVSSLAHMASGAQPVAGASGNKQFNYSAATAYTVAQMGAILSEPPVPGNGLTAGGRERFTVRRTPKNRRRYR